MPSSAPRRWSSDWRWSTAASGVGPADAGRRALDAQRVGRVGGDLLRAPRRAGLVDAGVAGDLVQPRAEAQRPVAGAQRAQGGDEDVLGDVLRPRGVGAAAPHEGPDPRRVAVVELLEGEVVPGTDGSHERLVGGVRARARAKAGDDRCHLASAPLRHVL